MTEKILITDGGGYVYVVGAILNHGKPRRARGLLTRDLGLTTITITDPTDALPLGIGRNLKPAIGAVEALQLIAGVVRPDLVLKIAPQFRRYMDPVGSSGASYFHGAYGNRIHMQAACAVRKLQEDRDTRQAIITLWDPFQDNVHGMHDYPCTIGMGFSVDPRNWNVLTMDVMMRSNDVWLGFPYDIFQFTQLQHSVANSLNMLAGEYRHTTFSLHMYESDVDAVTEFLGSSKSMTFQKRPRGHQPIGVGTRGMPYEQIMTRARHILDNDPLLPYDEMTPSEQWYHRHLHKTHGAHND